MENAGVYSRIGHSNRDAIATTREIIRAAHGRGLTAGLSMTAIVLSRTGFLAGEGLRLTSP
jgi:hypothetical protein